LLIRQVLRQTILEPGLAKHQIKFFITITGFVVEGLLMHKLSKKKNWTLFLTCWFRVTSLQSDFAFLILTYVPRVKPYIAEISRFTV